MGTQANKVYCLNAQGNGSGGTNTLWVKDLGAPIVSSPAIYNGLLYVTANNATGKNIFCLGGSEIAIGNITGGWAGFLKGGKVTAEVKNIGIIDAVNVHWTITVQGGFLGLINVTKSGDIPKLTVDSTEPIQVSPIYGLGKVNITVEISADNALPVIKEATGFVFFIFVLGVK